MNTKNLDKLEPTQFLLIRTRPMLEGKDVRVTPTDRQERLAGFDQAKVAQTGILCCGAGGLAGEQAVGLVRKGYGRFTCLDPDEFDATNYPRQRCFAEDLHRNKAVCFAKNLAKEALLGTEILGLPMTYADAREYLDWADYQVALCNVDNNLTRVEMARDMRKLGIPVVIAGVSDDARCGYAFVQEATDGAACFGCVFPDKVNDRRVPCPNTPACVDILKVLGGYILYAIDSLIMNRPRHWNYRVVHLSGFVEDSATIVPRNPNCPLCGKGALKS